MVTAMNVLQKVIAVEGDGTYNGKKAMCSQGIKYRFVTEGQALEGGEVSAKEDGGEMGRGSGFC